MTDPNDLAFPIMGNSGEKNSYGECKIPPTVGANGLTKREYFAALAMQGMLGNSRIVNDDEDDGSNARDEIQQEWIAQASLELADALIDELSK